MEIFLIAAVDKNLAIGKNGKIPWHIKEDLRHFKKNTLNTTIIMGRACLLYTSPSPRDKRQSRMPSSA